MCGRSTWNEANKSELWRTQGKTKGTNDRVKVCFMYSKVAKTKRQFAEGCSLSKLFSLAVEIRLHLSTMAHSFSPLQPLPQLSFREPREPSSPGTLQQLALNAVQNPGETARQFLPPWHSVRKELEEKEFTDNRKK